MKIWKTNNNTVVYKLMGIRSNVYLIKSDKKTIIVDTGTKSTYKRLKKKIKKNIGQNNIDWLVLTHTHFDHCQNAYNLKKDFNCDIVASIKESEYTKSGFTPIPNGTNFLTKRIVKFGRNLKTIFFSYKAFSIDTEVSDQHFLTDQIRIISSQGHSKGSLCLIIDNEIAIVGDTLFGIFPTTTFPPFADDVVELKKSWLKLSETECKIFLPGHGKNISKAKFLNNLKKWKKKSNKMIINKN